MTRSDRAQRLVHAEAAVVFTALTDPALLAGWLPPEGMTGRFEHVDVRPGGSYRLVLTYRDPGAAPGKTTGGSDVVEARFLEVVPDRRVVQAVDFVSDDAAYAGTMTMTWSLSPLDGGTLVELRADDVPRGITAADHAAGMASSLANLAALLEGLPRRGSSPTGSSQATG